MKNKLPSVLIMSSFLKPVLSFLANKVDVINYWELCEKAKAHVLPNIVGIIASPWDVIDGKFLELCPQLKVISNFGVGLDNIDQVTAKIRKVCIVNTPDLVTNDTADLALGMIISLSRNIVFNDKYIRDGLWKSSPAPLNTSLTNKKLGIVGLGNIGKAIADRASACKLEVYYWSRKRKPNTPYQYIGKLIDLASTVDMLVICCAGVPETKHLIQMDILKALGKNAVLINISRGSVINQEALILALKNKVIAAAALDVFENEPHIPGELINMSNTLLQPHMGSATKETRLAMYKLAAQNILIKLNIGESKMNLRSKT